MRRKIEGEAVGAAGAAAGAAAGLDGNDAISGAPATGQAGAVWAGGEFGEGGTDCAHARPAPATNVVIEPRKPFRIADSYIRSIRSAGPSI